MCERETQRGSVIAGQTSHKSIICHWKVIIFLQLRVLGLFYSFYTIEYNNYIWPRYLAYFIYLFKKKNHPCSIFYPFNAAEHPWNKSVPVCYSSYKRPSPYQQRLVSLSPAFGANTLRAFCTTSESFSGDSLNPRPEEAQFVRTLAKDASSLVFRTVRMVTHSQI